jgi:hypothetical protein
MGRNKNYYIVLDVETCNTIEQPLPYDIGWVVCDRYGNIYERHSYIISEIFFGMHDVMKSAYYAEKIPQYFQDLANGNRTVKSMYEIRRIMKDEIKRYKIKAVGGYNMAFDYRSLNNCIRYVSKSFLRWWFPFGTQFFDIWAMACSTILNRNTYRKFCDENGFVSEKGNYQSSAEVAYRYIKRNLDFTEAHTGLEDVLIETEILKECFRQHKKMVRDMGLQPWRWIQK